MLRNVDHCPGRMVSLCSLDVDKFCSMKKSLTSACSHLHMPAAKIKKKTAQYWEQGKIKPLDLENKTTALVMLVGVSCINFHCFALGILTDGKQKNLNPSYGLYTLPTNSTSFQVSAIGQ